MKLVKLSTGGRLARPILVGPNLGEELAEAPRTKSGDLDYRFKAARRVRSDLKPGPWFPYMAQEYRPEFEQEVSRRKYPKALRPQIVFNKDGGHMTWDNWLASTTAFGPISRMIFEDGVEVRG